MKVVKGFKIRIYPNKAQKYLMEKTFGCCRYVYNRFLDVRKASWQERKESVSYSKTSAMLTVLKKDDEHIWLNEVDSMALQESLKNLDNGYQNFFSKRAGYPKFKKKHNTQAYRTRNQANGVRFVDDKHIHLPKIGNIKIKTSKIPIGRILNATVIRMASGRYYVSLCIEEELVPKTNLGCLIGLDVGLKFFYTDSNGNAVYAPKPLRCFEKKLKKEQRKLSRMIEANIAGYTKSRRPVYKQPLSECKNIQKQRIKIARLHEKIAAIRLDFLHKVTTALVNENQVICIEDLNIKGMMKNHHLAKAISDVSWSVFFRLLEYKAFEHGTDVVKIPTFYPSSQTCHICGFKNPITKNLGIRAWTCHNCNASHDRDTNAAINILNKGLEILNSKAS